MSAKTKHKYGRIKLKISPLFLLLAVFFLLSEKWLYFTLYLISTLAHECAHAIVAKGLGYRLNSIKLMPYGVALEGEFQALRTTDEILIALAGPILNLVLALICPTIWWLFPALNSTAKTLGSVNLTLLLINLIPAYPLDGGRVFLALISCKSSRATAYKKARVISLVIGIIATALALLSLPLRKNPTVVVFCSFIILSALLPDGSYYESVFRQSSRFERIKQGLPIREILVDKSVTVKAMRKHLTVNFYTQFIVVDDELKPRLRISETMLDGASGIDFTLSAEEFYRKIKQS